MLTQTVMTPAMAAVREKVGKASHQLAQKPWCVLQHSQQQQQQQEVLPVQQQPQHAALPESPQHRRQQQQQGIELLWCRCGCVQPV
jgi:hypothetical protein